MNTTDLIQDAHMMLENIKLCKSPSVRAASARQLADIATQLQSAVSLPEPSQPEHDEEPPAMIDLAMEYRTRGGRKATNLKKSEHSDYMFCGEVNGASQLWTASGCYWLDGRESILDLIPTGELA